MATLNNIDRARYIMDLLKDGTVTNLSDYANVEKIGQVEALKYAQAFWDNFPHPSTDPANPTNAQLSLFYLNKLRQYHKQVLGYGRVADAANTEQTTVLSEGDTDLGTDEGIG